MSKLDRSDPFVIGAHKALLRNPCKEVMFKKRKDLCKLKDRDVAMVEIFQISDVIKTGNSELVTWFYDNHWEKHRSKGFSVARLATFFMYNVQDAIALTDAELASLGNVLRYMINEKKGTSDQLLKVAMAIPVDIVAATIGNLLDDMFIAGNGYAMDYAIRSKFSQTYKVWDYLIPTYFHEHIYEVYNTQDDSMERIADILCRIQAYRALLFMVQRYEKCPCKFRFDALEDRAHAEDMHALLCFLEWQGKTGSLEFQTLEDKVDDRVEPLMEYLIERITLREIIWRLPIRHHMDAVIRKIENATSPQKYYASLYLRLLQRSPWCDEELLRDILFKAGEINVENHAFSLRLLKSGDTLSAQTAWQIYHMAKKHGENSAEFAKFLMSDCGIEIDAEMVYNHGMDNVLGWMYDTHHEAVDGSIGCYYWHVSPISSGITRREYEFLVEQDEIHVDGNGWISNLEWTDENEEFDYYAEKYEFQSKPDEPKWPKKRWETQCEYDCPSQMIIAQSLLICAAEPESEMFQTIEFLLSTPEGLGHMKHTLEDQHRVTYRGVIHMAHLYTFFASEACFDVLYVPYDLIPPVRHLLRVWKWPSTVSHLQKMIDIYKPLLESVDAVEPGTDEDDGDEDCYDSEDEGEGEGSYSGEEAYSKWMEAMMLYYIKEDNQDCIKLLISINDVSDSSL